MPIAELTRPDFDVPPIVRFTEPRAGHGARHDRAWEVDAHDVDGAIASVRFELPSGPVTITEAPWRIEWDTTQAERAAHDPRRRDGRARRDARSRPARFCVQN